MSSDPGANQSIMGEPGWEFTLFAGELNRGLAALDGDYQSFLDGDVDAGGDSVNDPVNDLVHRLAVSRAIVGRIGRILSPDATSEAFGSPGQSGNPDAARKLARSIVTVFSTMLQWGRDARSAVVDSQWQTVYGALANFARQPLRQISAFANDISAKAEVMRAELEQGRSPSAPPSIALEIAVDAGDLATLSNVIAAADVVPRPARKKTRFPRR